MNELFFKLLDEIDPNKLNMVYSSANGMTVLKSSEYDFKLEQVDKLKRENIKIQQRIEKAIEYIKYALDEEKETPSKYHDWRLDILEILKGDNK